MAGVAVGDPVVALKLSPTVLFSAATGNNVTYHGQNLTFTAEEQINATRLFKQLYSQIETTLALRDRKELDVKEAMEKTLALDKAYLLPLLGSMVEKFPENSEPAIWWSKPNVSPSRKQANKILAICGPLLTGTEASGSAFVGHGSWAVIVAVTEAA
ncbi:F-box protein [Populus alba x Populus x berolinensis]|uniref:F-box protein n=1 Tax=Populus alba x Populus x berolinensis TaxID=444605 RepID=A0AAD6QZ83_9ROSI|nr:F-box protein [Populus alba x Populus x berolinensis]